MSNIDLDELLNGSPSWDDVVDYFKNGDFHEEHYFVEAIECYLLTEEQRHIIFDNRSSIEKMLNGRVEGDTTWRDEIFAQWNDKLGIATFRC